MTFYLPSTKHPVTCGGGLSSHLLSWTFRLNESHEDATHADYAWPNIQHTLGRTVPSASIVKDVRNISQLLALLTARLCDEPLLTCRSSPYCWDASRVVRVLPRESPPLRAIQAFCHCQNHATRGGILTGIGASMNSTKKQTGQCGANVARCFSLPPILPFLCAGLCFGKTG